MHPQNPDLSLVDFLESLLREGRLDAIGELGFDFFTEDFLYGLRSIHDLPYQYGIFYPNIYMIYEWGRNNA